MDHQKLMTPSDLRAWQDSMGLNFEAAHKALGVHKSTYARLLSGEHAIDLRTALACAALAAGLNPWVSEPASQAVDQAQG